MRITLEMKSFIDYLGEYCNTDNTDIIETALKEHYNRLFATFKATK
jgi:hypothetical protein